MHHNLQNILTCDTEILCSELALESSTARIEIQCLLQKVLKVQRASLLAYPERVLDGAELTLYNEFLQRRLLGEPIAYILGEREFFGLNLAVTPATLIPRPDTELLVEQAIERITAPEHCTVLDLGTGSGAVALAIAKDCPQAVVLACDNSPDALEVAQRNARELGIGNVSFMQSDWFAALGEQRFTLILSNPPYVASDDPHLLRGDLRFEPSTALVSGPDGLDDIRRIITASADYLHPGGWLLLEHGYEQAQKVRDLLQQAEYEEIFTSFDLSGIERVTGGRRHMS